MPICSPLLSKASKLSIVFSTIQIYIYIIFVESGWFELGLPIRIRRYEIVVNEIRIDKRKANRGKEWKKNRIDIVSVKEIDVQPLNRASWLDASTV